MYDKWKPEWTQCGGVLREVQDTPDPWHKICVILRHEVISYSLKTGHTWITQNHLQSAQFATKQE